MSYWDNRAAQCPAADEGVPHRAHRWDQNDVPGTAYCSGVKTGDPEQVDVRLGAQEAEARIRRDERRKCAQRIEAGLAQWSDVSDQYKRGLRAAVILADPTDWQGQQVDPANSLVDPSSDR